MLEYHVARGEEIAFAKRLTALSWNGWNGNEMDRNCFTKILEKYPRATGENQNGFSSILVELSDFFLRSCVLN